MYSLFFFFNDTATTEIYTLSLHDALPIYLQRALDVFADGLGRGAINNSIWGQDGHAYPYLAPLWSNPRFRALIKPDRKSTRLNSSHLVISYAVFCLKKKKKINTTTYPHAH